MKKALLFLIALGLFTFSFAQEKKHTLAYNDGFFVNDYLIDGQEVSSTEFERELVNDYYAIRKWETGNTMKYISLGMAFGGGILMGYGAYQGSLYNAPQGYHVLLMAGGALLVASLVLDIIGNSKKRTAVKLYNKNSGATASNNSLSMDIVPTEQGGIALAFKF